MLIERYCDAGNNHTYDVVHKVDDLCTASLSSFIYIVGFLLMYHK